MIGIKFKIKDEYNVFLDMILSHIESDNFKWIIVESEVYTKNGLELFDKTIYSNDEFKKLVKNENYYTVFSNVQLYNVEDEVCEIRNYEEFLKSKCILVAFITDSSFVEIYAKDMELLKILKNNAITSNFFAIEPITFSEKVRKVFSAYTD